MFKNASSHASRLPISAFLVMAVGLMTGCGNFGVSPTASVTTAVTSSTGDETAGTSHSSENSSTTTESPSAHPSSFLFSEYQGMVGVPNCFAGAPNIQSRILYYKSVYSSGQSQQISLRAHVIYPANYNSGSSYPTIALFHAGGWQSGSPSDELSQAFYWASRGMIAVSFEYRLYNLYGQSATSIEDGVADAKTAMRWMRKYATQLSIDPNRIVVSGDSAGGHLALAIALADSVSDETSTDASISTLPAAIFAFYPVVDLKLFYTTAAGLADARTHDPNLALVSPIDLAAKGKTAPPTIIWDGTKETMWLTPYGSDYNYCQVAKQTNPNGLCSFTWVNGADHGFLANPSTYQSVLPIMDTWLINMGYIGGDPLNTPATMKTAGGMCNHMDAGLMAQWTQMYGYPH